MRVEYVGECSDARRGQNAEENGEVGVVWGFGEMSARRLPLLRGGSLLFALLCFACLLAFVEACFRVGLLALPLCGAAPTFFAAAKKVGKESSSATARCHTHVGQFSPCRWHSPKECPRRPSRAWIAHGLTRHNFKGAGSARKSIGTALRAAVGYARETSGRRRPAQTRLTRRPRSGLERAGALPLR